MLTNAREEFREFLSEPQRVATLCGLSQQAELLLGGPVIARLQREIDLLAERHLPSWVARLHRGKRPRLLLTRLGEINRRLLLRQL